MLKKQLQKITLLFLWIMGIHAALNGQAASEKITRLRHIIDQHIQEMGFTGTILIADHGRPLLHQSYGTAYLGSTDSLQNAYHYSIASITKLFTALRILQLVEQQKLSLDQSLADLLPDLQIPSQEKITVHHLLLHISGLPNEKDKFYRKAYTPKDFVQVNLKNGTAKTPGTFHYNNLDYILLGRIIEGVTEMSWQQNIRQFILEPLGMNETGFLAWGAYPNDFAYTFSYPQKGKPQRDLLFHIENMFAAGCMYSTAEDLLRLDQALYSDRLINRQTYQLLSRSYPEYNYTGYSVWNYTYPFIESQPTIMERRGGILGANVVLVRMPDTRQTILILSNNNCFNPDSFGDADNLREALIRVLAE